MPSDFMGHMPSGKMSVSACSIRPATIAQAGTRKMDAGRIGSDEALINLRVSWFFLPKEGGFHGGNINRMDGRHLESSGWLHRAHRGLHQLLCHANGRA